MRGCNYYCSVAVRPGELRIFLLCHLSTCLKGLFFVAEDIPLHGMPCMFIHSMVGRHLDYFQFLEVTNSGILNICIEFYGHVFIFLRS